MNDILYRLGTIAAVVIIYFIAYALYLLINSNRR